jgi:hypothetical protein
MNFEEVKRRLDAERRYLCHDGESIHVLPHVTRTVDGHFRMVIASALDDATVDEATVDRTIDEEIAHVGADLKSFEWKFYSHDKPDDLLKRLQRHGLVAGPAEAVMVFDLADGRPPCASEGFVVERITRKQQIEDYRLVAEEGLRIDRGIIDHLCSRLAESLARGSTQRVGYVAYAGKEPVCIGRLFTHPLSAFGGLYGGTTREAWRGRGFYRALVAARAKDAIESGARYLLVDALPTSRPILERLGFERLTETIPCTGP